MEKLVKKELPETFDKRRGPLLERMSHLANYQHTRALYEQVKLEIEKLKEYAGDKPQFKNPREEMDFTHKKKTLQVLNKQVKHFERKLKTLQELIRHDMATFEKEVTNT
jgi:hypothetical protein